MQERSVCEGWRVWPKREGEGEVEEVEDREEAEPSIDAHILDGDLRDIPAQKSWSFVEVYTPSTGDSEIHEDDKKKQQRPRAQKRPTHVFTPTPQFFRNRRSPTARASLHRDP